MYHVRISETFIENGSSGVNILGREGAIDDIESSSELVCRLGERGTIIEPNFAVKSVRRPKLLMVV